MFRFWTFSSSLFSIAIRSLIGNERYETPIGSRVPGSSNWDSDCCCCIVLPDRQALRFRDAAAVGAALAVSEDAAGLEAVTRCLERIGTILAARNWDWKNLTRFFFLWNDEGCAVRDGGGDFGG